MHTSARKSNPADRTGSESARLDWGRPTKGLRAAVEFIPEKASYSLGETMGLRFHVHNSSDRTIQFTTTDWRQTDGIGVEDEKGREILIIRGRFSGEPSLIRIRLAPGQVAVLESAALSFGNPPDGSSSLRVGYRVQCRPGRYFLQAGLPFPNATSSDFPAEEDDWRGALEPGKRKLVIVPAPVKSERVRP